jgi:HSP20 family molecular chaperone IbpA
MSLLHPFLRVLDDYDPWLLALEAPLRGPPATVWLDGVQEPTLQHQRRLQQQQRMRQRQSQQPVAKNDEHNFAVAVDVSHFKPEEISVRTTEGVVEIEGQHEEKMDEHGFVKRHFVRKFKLPEGTDPEKVASSLTNNGLLTIQAPRVQKEQQPKVRKVPIQRVQYNKGEEPK